MNENTAMTVYGDENYVMMNQEFDVMSLMAVETNYVKIFAPNFHMDEADLYNSVQSPAKTVSDSIGDTFNLMGVIAHPVQVIDERTGEIIPSPRIILLGSEGESYVSVSKTMFSSLKNLFAMYKNPADWSENGIPVKLRQYSKNEKRYFSLEIIKG